VLGLPPWKVPILSTLKLFIKFIFCLSRTPPGTVVLCAVHAKAAKRFKTTSEIYKSQAHPHKWGIFEKNILKSLFP
jgi:hypothetical protein